jgi:pimeloyl-ACP methyl ester carboxylesterase
MIGTPPHFNHGYMDTIDANWERNASKERKMIYDSNQQFLNSLNKDTITKEKWNYLKYETRVPKDWYNPRYDVSELYPQFRVNNKGWRHFFSLMRNYDIARTPIDVPIFLSLGEYDYVMPEFMWDDYQDKLEELSVYRFKKSGHYPHVEEQKDFDHKLLNWARLE